MLRWPSFPVRTTKKGGHYTLARLLDTDYGHTERAFFQKFKIFWLGQTNWTENLWGIWAISGQTISTILALWVPYPWESVAGPLSYKKLWFLGLKHITPKYSQNKIWAVKNLGNSVHISVFSAKHKYFKPEWLIESTICNLQFWTLNRISSLVLRKMVV